MTHCDAAKEIHNERLVQWLHDNLPAVQKHVLAAGIVSFDLILDMQPSEFHRVVAPKVRQGPTLRRLTLRLAIKHSTPAPALCHLCRR